jgi:hypothetical protein
MAVVSRGHVHQLVTGEWVVLRPGDMMYRDQDMAEYALRRGDDLEQKVGCHLVWESPTLADTDIARKLRALWRPEPGGNYAVRTGAETRDAGTTPEGWQLSEFTGRFRIEVTAERDDVAAVLRYLADHYGRTST